MKLKAFLSKAAVCLVFCGVLYSIPISYAAVQDGIAEKEQIVTTEAAVDNSQSVDNAVEDAAKADVQDNKRDEPQDNVLLSEQNQEERLAKLQADIASKAAGYTLYIALLAAIFGAFAVTIAIFAFVRLNSNSKNNLKNFRNQRDEITELKREWSSLKAQYQNFEENSNQLEKQISSIRRNIIASESYSPVPMDSLSNMGRKNISPSSNISNIVRPAEPENDNARINRRHKEVLAEYSNLIMLYMNKEQQLFRKKRSEFFSKYMVEEFACSNQNDRLTNHAAPVFTAMPNGTFWAIPVPQANDAYLVYPIPTLDYEANVHNVGGMNEVFESNFKVGVKYNGFSVNKPAIFKKQNTSWKCISKGQLELKS